MQTAEILLRLYENQLDCRNRRRDYEWKITILFWTGAIVSTGFLANQFKLEQRHIFLNIVIFVLILWMLFVFFWLRGIWKSNAVDKKYADVYRSNIEAIIRMRSVESIVKYEEPCWCDFIIDYSMQFQALFSLALLILICYMLYNLPGA